MGGADNIDWNYMSIYFCIIISTHILKYMKKDEFVWMLRVFNGLCEY